MLSGEIRYLGQTPVSAQLTLRKSKKKNNIILYIRLVDLLFSVANVDLQYQDYMISHQHRQSQLSSISQADIKQQIRIQKQNNNALWNRQIDRLVFNIKKSKKVIEKKVGFQQSRFQKKISFVKSNNYLDKLNTNVIDKLSSTRPLRSLSIKLTSPPINKPINLTPKPKTQRVQIRSKSQISSKTPKKKRIATAKQQQNNIQALGYQEQMIDRIARQTDPAISKTLMRSNMGWIANIVRRVKQKKTKLRMQEMLENIFERRKAKQEQAGRTVTKCISNRLEQLLRRYQNIKLI